VLCRDENSEAMLLLLAQTLRSLPGGQANDVWSPRHDGDLPSKVAHPQRLFRVEQIDCWSIFCYITQIVQSLGYTDHVTKR